MKPEDVCEYIRTQSVAWQNAKSEYDQLTDQLSYDSLVAKNVNHSDLQKVMNSVVGEFRGSVNAMISDSFVVDYTLRCNLDKPAKYQIECLGLTFNVKWERRDVLVKCGQPVLEPVVLSPYLKAQIADDRVRDLNKFAGETGLNTSIAPQKLIALLRVFQAGAIGQSKITRLVKGCLHLLDHLENGGKHYEDYRFVKSIEYTVDDLVSTLSYPNSAYVHTDYTNGYEPDSCNAFLAAMCEEYPHPVFGGSKHIKIPADAANIFLVGFEIPMAKTRVCWTAELLWGTLVEYAKRFSLGKDLHSALAIACSLRQNRYMTTVYLPAVVSHCDLIYPALNKVVYGNIPLINHGAGVVLGRFHQMLSFLLFKDLDTSFANSTSEMKMNFDRDLKSVLRRDQLPFLEYMDDNSVADILKITKQMSWLSGLDDKGIEFLRNTSVFEAFWVIKNPKNVLRDGIIKCLKKGKYERLPGMNLDSSFKTLDREVTLGSLNTSVADMPYGGYNICLDVVHAIASYKAPKSIVFTKRGVTKSFASGSIKGPKALHTFRKPSVAGWEMDDEGNILGE